MGKFFPFFLFFPFLISISFFFLNLTSTRHSKTHQCLLFSQMLRGLSGAMDVTDFSIVEQWLPRAKAAVAEGPRLEAERAARPCVTWPTERFDAAVKELATEKQRRGGEGQEQVLLISEGGGQGQEKAAEGVEEARAAAADATASASAALPSPPPPPPPPPAGTRTTDCPPRASSSSSASTATATIEPTQVTPEVPSTVAYSAAVVGAAPTHLQELVESKKKDDSASEAASASAAAAATTTEAPKSASVPSPVALPSAESSRAKGMRLSFRAVPALDFVAVEREGEKDEREVGASATKA